VAGRDIFSSCKAEDESGLTPGEDDNAAGRKKNRPDAAQGLQDRSNNSYKGDFSSMLEIFTYMAFIQKNSKLAKERGRNNVWAGIYTFLLLFGFELAGYIFGLILFWESESFYLPYIFAFPCLFLGALVSWAIAKRGQPIFPSYYPVNPQYPNPNGWMPPAAPNPQAYGVPPAAPNSPAYAAAQPAPQYHPNYQSTPALPPKLSSACHLMICRDLNTFNATLIYRIELNNQLIGSVQNGQYITGKTKLRSNCVVDVDPYGNRGGMPFFFDAPDGGSVELHFSGNRFVPEMTVIRPPV